MRNDEIWDKKLHISTGASGYEKDDAHHSRYEPTSYAVLERLAQSGHITRDNVLVDYGCGKGRVGLYLDFAVGCRTIGVEYDPEVFAQAQENLSSYAARNPRCRAEFLCADAAQYIPADADCFFFFNPFSAQLLKSVLRRIYDTWYEHPRALKFFFYYTLNDSLACLIGEDMLQLTDEIDCRDLFDGNDEHEKILVFTVDAP